MENSSLLEGKKQRTGRPSAKILYIPGVDDNSHGPSMCRGRRSAEISKMRSYHDEYSADCGCYFNRDIALELHGLGLFSIYVSSLLKRMALGELEADDVVVVGAVGV